MKKAMMLCTIVALAAVGVLNFAPEAHAYISQPACSDLGDCARVAYWWYFLR